MKYDKFWLLLSRDDVSLCLTDPGFGLDVLVTADLSAFFQIWLGRLTFDAALLDGRVEIDGIPVLAEAVPTWFAYSLAAPAVRSVMAGA